MTLVLVKYLNKRTILEAKNFWYFYILLLATYEQSFIGICDANRVRGSHYEYFYLAIASEESVKSLPSLFELQVTPLL